MKKTGSIFLFLVFGCALAFGQVQPDPRVLVKQAGATTGQVLKWDGTKWVPDTDIGADGNGIYSGSGTVPNNTTATLTDDFTFAGVDNTGTQAPKFRVTATGTDPGVQVWKVGNDSLQLSFIAGEPTIEYAGQSANDLWIKTGVHDLRIDGASFQTYPTKNIFGGYVATPYVQVAANTTINENIQSVDVLGATGSVTLTFDNTTNLLGTYSKTITVRNRGAHNVVLSRGSQSWEWSDFTGANTASNQTLLPGETGTMFWEDAGTTDYYVLQKIPSTFASGSGDILNGGNTGAVVIGTNDNNTLSFETNGVTRATISTGSSDGGKLTISNVSANTSTPEDAFVVQSNSNGTASTGFGPALFLQGESSTTNNRNMARVGAVWTTATDASREAKLSFQLGNNASTLTEVANINVSGSDIGQLSVGSSTPVTLQPTGLTIGTNFAIGGGSNTLTLGGGVGQVVMNGTSNGYAIDINASGNTGFVGIGGTTASTITAGTKTNVEFPQGFTVSSGSGTFNNILLSGTINQSGTATGEVHGIHVNHTITSALKYRGVQLDVDGTNVSGIYQTGANATNNFVGKTFFGATTAPTAMLHLGAGTTTLAPLKLTSGTNLTTPQAGAIEWDGTNLFVTQTTGPTRKTIAYTSDITGGGYSTVQEEGTSQTQRAIINFVGSTATATDNATKTDVTFDSDVNALASTASTGLYSVTGTGTSATRTITAPAAGITVSNGDGVSGNPTLALANDLSAVEGLSSNGVAVRTGTDTWAVRTITAGAGISISNGDGVSGNPTISATAGGEVVISPASFSTDQNNWNPTDLATATIIRVTSSVNLLMITGITAPATSKKLILVNIGSNTLLLTAQDANSSAANRFQFKKDVPIFPGGSVTILYDLTSAVWRLESSSLEHKFVSDREVSVQYQANYINEISGDANLSSGGTYVAPTATTPAGVLMNAPSTYSYNLIGEYLSGNIQYFYSSNSARVSAYTETTIVTPSSLSDATNNYALAGGFLVSAAAASEPQGMSIFYNHSVNSGKWLCYTKGSSSSTVDSGVTFAVSTKYKLAVQVRPDNSVVYFIDDVLVGKTTTNMPTSALFAGTQFSKLAGTGRTYTVYNMEARQIR